MPKVAFFTLGCKVNQYESAAMAELFLKRGYEIVDFQSGKADIYIINTCDVTNESARKSRQTIRRATRNNPKSRVAVVGCYAQMESEEVSSLPGVTLVVGTKDRHRIVDLLEEAIREDEQVIAVGDIMKERAFEEIAFKGHRQKTRAFLKVQEGCNMFCSYCIIPYARGPVRSRSLDSILDETRKLAKDGFKEIVLTGIHLGLYGCDLNRDGIPLLEVISEIAKIDGICRIRLSSIEALELTDKFIDGVYSIKKFCHHFHVPLQSGSDTILKRMNRRYSTADFKERIHYIRQIMPDASITTDVIVGFPGETDDEFLETVDFIREIRFSKLHVFPFSPRRKTPAASMPNPIEKSIKQERGHKLIELSSELEKEFRSQFIGEEREVLFEEEKNDNIYEGLTDNYMKVLALSHFDLHNQIIEVPLTENKEDHFWSKVVN